MADPISAALLGVVEGITEILPISSTGHLIVAADLLQFNSAAAFEIIIQLGAVVAVIWFYHRQLLEQAKQLPHERSVQRFWLNIILAFIPAAVIGLLLGDYIERVLFSPQIVALSLIVGGVILWIIESIPKRPVTYEASRITVRQAFIVGLAQLAALVPGVSRSGATIVGGMLSGLDRSAATGFSFYLAIPTLGAATLYSLIKDFGAVTGGSLLDITIGMVVSFITSLVAMGWLLRYIAKHDFKGFAVYRIVAGIAILLFFGWPV
jgi:undecaprenyl-diphosphatase